MTERYQIPLRLPRDIAVRLKAHAESNSLSLNTAIVQAIERTLGAGVASESRPEPPSHFEAKGHRAKDSILRADAPAAGSYRCAVCDRVVGSPTVRCPCSNRLPVWKD